MLSYIVRPKYKEDGYFPHFTKELNAKMMDSMMRHFDELDNAVIDMKHDSKSINEIINDIQVATFSHVSCLSI